MTSDTSVPKLVPRREVDQVTGIADISYYWEERLAPKIQITGKLVDQLSGYTLIKKDLDNALQWVRLAETLTSAHRKSGEKGYFHAKDRKDFDIIKAYFVASLTFYGKCFTEAAGRNAQVQRDWLDIKFRDLHDFYMKYRHNFAAHSGDERLELARTYVLVHPDRRSLLPYLPTARLQPGVALFDEGELGFGNLIEHAANKVVEKYSKLAQKIIDECVFPVSVEDWSSAADKRELVSLKLSSMAKS
jgi:hypothetical protein